MHKNPYIHSYSFVRKNFTKRNFTIEVKLKKRNETVTKIEKVNATTGTVGTVGTVTD